MQNDLISRSALIEYMCRSCTSKCNLDDECCCSVDAVEKAPAVDAVEVVRCKDCKHWHEHTGWCHHHSHFVTPDGEACHPWESADWKTLDENDFCSYGERKQGDTNG